MSQHRFYVIAISAVAALGGFLFGFDSGVINGTVDALNHAFHTSNFGSGFNVASILLGCAAGAFIAGGLADKLGRRVVLLGAAILFVGASWGTGIAHGSLEFIAYRVMGGLAVGAASIICPAYISDIAPARNPIVGIAHSRFVTATNDSWISRSRGSTCGSPTRVRTLRAAGLR